MAGIPRFFASSIASTAVSIEYLKTPGMADTGSILFDPSQMNKGQIRSSTDMVFSLTNLLDHSVLLFLLIRVDGKERPVEFDPSCGYCLLLSEGIFPPFNSFEGNNLSIISI